MFLHSIDEDITAKNSATDTAMKQSSTITSETVKSLKIGDAVYLVTLGFLDWVLMNTLWKSVPLLQLTASSNAELTGAQFDEIVANMHMATYESSLLLLPLPFKMPDTTTADTG